MNLCFEAEEDRHCNLFQNNHPVLHILKYFQTDQSQARNQAKAILIRLDLDTDKPSEEEVAKRFGYEDDYYAGKYLKIQKGGKCNINANCSIQDS